MSRRDFTQLTGALVTACLGVCWLCPLWPLRAGSLSPAGPLLIEDGIRCQQDVTAWLWSCEPSCLTSHSWASVQPPPPRAQAMGRPAQGEGAAPALATSCWKGVEVRVRGTKLSYIPLKIFFISQFTINTLFYHNVCFFPGSPAFTPKGETLSQNIQPLTARKHNMIRIINIRHPCNNPRKRPSIPESSQEKRLFNNKSCFFMSCS